MSGMVGSKGVLRTLPFCAACLLPRTTPLGQAPPDKAEKAAPPSHSPTLLGKSLHSSLIPRGAASRPSPGGASRGPMASAHTPACWGTGCPEPGPGLPSLLRSTSLCPSPTPSPSNSASPCCHPERHPGESQRVGPTRTGANQPSPDVRSMQEGGAPELEPFPLVPWAHTKLALRASVR